MNRRGAFHPGDRVLIASGHTAIVVLAQDGRALVHIPDFPAGSRYRVALVSTLVRA